MRALKAIVLLAMMLLAAPAMAEDAMTWPHTMTGPNGASVVVYQPQAIAWPDQKTLTTREALAITPRGAKTPIFGTIELSFATQTDLATHTVILTEPKLTASHFPSLATDQAAQFEARIREAVAKIPEKRIPLNSVLLGLEAPPQQTKPVAVNNDPPVIFHADRPASLVVFDGEPVLTPAGNSGLKYAVNTNWDVFFDGAGSGTWYLLNNGLWLSAPAATGPYKLVTSLPEAFRRLPADANFADARKAMPPKPASAAQVPTVFVSTKPAEIIVMSGPMQLVPVTGTGLQFVKNTASDLFFYPANGHFYYLVSGRWFTSVGLDGPWSYASGSLPPDFAAIPPNSPYAGVLASVPGTVPAQLAVLQAQIPQQATLKRATAKLTVTYSGPPVFRPIVGTDMTYAVNTEYQVLGVEGRYYACYQGAWFVSNSPNGPWTLAASVPPTIYTIPPSSPVYNTTYVTVYGSTAETVTYGYTSGYTLGYVSAGMVVYGTGYYYPPYVVPGVVPIFFPYPYSYAGAVWYNSATGAWARGGAVYGPYYGAAAGRAYNPATGAWAHGAAVYGPYGGAGAWSAYNPSTGAYAHGSAAWGPNGGTAHANFYNPSTGVSGHTTQNANAYSRWGSSTVSGPNKTVNTASASNARGSVGAFSSSTGAEGAGVHTSTGNNAAVARGANGDVYAGANGNAYKHTDDGWSKWENGSWQPTQASQNKSNWQQDWQNRMSGSRSDTFDNSNWSQRLDQDRSAREGGWDRGSFGGGGFGGGRWRR